MQLFLLTYIPFSFWLTAVKESSGLTARWFMGAPNLGRNSRWWVLYCHITNTPSCPPDSILEPAVKVRSSLRVAVTAWHSALILHCMHCQYFVFRQLQCTLYTIQNSILNIVLHYNIDNKQNFNIIDVHCSTTTCTTQLQSQQNSEVI